MTTTTANRNRTTYAKLKTGEWGLRVQAPEPPAPGTELTVEKRDGTRKQEVVERVVWSSEGVALCTIRRVGSSSAGESSARWKTCGYSGLRWLDNGGICPHCGDQC